MKNPDIQQVKITAIENAREGISISDARLPDNPLIFVNKGFVNMTGYTTEEVLGRNCRFLQGGKKHQQGVLNIRKAINSRQSIQEEIINYKKDGTLMWNRLSITPVFDEENNITHFIGIQEDITAQKQRDELELQLDNQVLVTKVTIEAEERQRKKIGEELHDNINQLLATTKLFLNVAEKQEDVRLDMLQKSREMLTQAIEEIQKLSRALAGPSVIEKSLEYSIKELIKLFRIGVAFSIEFVFDKEAEGNITESAKLAFYRIIQEQLNNIVKYASAANVIITIYFRCESIELSVRDDGIGFDPVIFTEGIGLKNIKNRAEMESGTLSITSEINKGCEIKVRVPVRK
jgi:PAS domain S-box-containing protein